MAKATSCWLTFCPGKPTWPVFPLNPWGETSKTMRLVQSITFQEEAAKENGQTCLWNPQHLLSDREQQPERQRWIKVMLLNARHVWSQSTRVYVYACLSDTWMHLYVHACVNGLCTNVCMCASVQMHAARWMHNCRHLYIRVYRIRVFISIHVCIYVCMHGDMYAWTVRSNVWAYKKCKCTNACTYWWMHVQCAIKEEKIYQIITYNNHGIYIPKRQ